MNTSATSEHIRLSGDGCDSAASAGALSPTIGGMTLSSAPYAGHSGSTEVHSAPCGVNCRPVVKFETGPSGTIVFSAFGAWIAASSGVVPS